MAQAYLLRLLDVLFVLCTLFSVLFLAFSVVLYRYWALGELLFASARPGRRRPGRTLPRGGTLRAGQGERSAGSEEALAPQGAFRIHRERVLIHTEERIP